jgi:hypothetical protein
MIMATGLMWAVLATGCGGNSGTDISTGGGGPNVTPNTGTAQSAVFITDDPTTAYSAVWVTIKAVTLTPGNVTLYNDPVGTTVNLRTLRDNNGALFQYLGSETVSLGSYTGVTVVLDKNVTLISNNSTTGQAYTFANANGSKNTVSVSFNLRNGAKAGDYIVVDFDLAQWAVSGTTVSPILRDGSQSSDIDGTRQVTCAVAGSVSGVSGTAPVQGFALAFGVNNQETLNVATNAGTDVFSSDGAPGAILANGQKVVVEGRWDPGNNNFAAAQIRTVPAKPAIVTPVAAVGTPSNVSTKDDSFDVAITRCSGIQPAASAIHVTHAASAKYFGARGKSIPKAEFLQLLNGASSVQVSGTFTASSQTLDGLILQVSNPAETAPVDAGGLASSISTINQSFDLTPSEFEGLDADKNSAVHVVFDSKTILTGPAGVSCTASQCLDALSADPKAVVFVSGNYDATTRTITASTVSYAPPKSARWSQVDGAVNTFSATANTMSLAVDGWENCNASAGQAMNVTVTPTTVYADAKGTAVNAASFFGALVKGVRVEASGSLNADGSMAAAKLDFASAATQKPILNPGATLPSGVPNASPSSKRPAGVPGPIPGMLPSRDLPPAPTSQKEAEQTG